MATALTSFSNDLNSSVARYTITSTTAASDIALSVGFNPRHIWMVQHTLGDMAEWVEGMTAEHVHTTVASTGARTVAASGGFVIADGVVTVPAALQPAAGICTLILTR